MKPIDSEEAKEWYMEPDICPICDTKFMMIDEPNFCPGCGEKFDTEEADKKTETCCICGEEFESHGSAYCSWSCIEKTVKREAHK